VATSNASNFGRGGVDCARRLEAETAKAAIAIHRVITI
jgi:hypothetical protein